MNTLTQILVFMEREVNKINKVITLDESEALQSAYQIQPFRKAEVTNHDHFPLPRDRLPLPDV